MLGDSFYRLIDDLKRDEGFCGKPYKCSTGHWTVGYGTTFPISKQEAELLLRHRVTAMEGELTLMLLNEYTVEFDRLPEAVKVALMNLTYNLGITRLKGFKRMLQAIRRGDWVSAAHECLDSAYSRQVGARAERVAALLRSPAGKRADNRTQEVSI